jgi:hypothetical protein
MSAKDDFDAHLAGLVQERDDESAGFNSMNAEWKNWKKEINQARDQVVELVDEHAKGLSDDSLLEDLREFHQTLTSSFLGNSTLAFEERTKLLLEGIIEKKQKGKEISEKLKVICREIDRHLDELKKKPTRFGQFKSRKARDIHSVSQLESQLSADARAVERFRDQVISHASNNQSILQSSGPMVAVLDGMIVCIEGIMNSIAVIEPNLKLLESTDIIAPKNADDWREKLLEQLKDREIHLHPNLQLGTSDLELYTKHLFDASSGQRKRALMAIEIETDSIRELLNTNLTSMAFHHFDFGFKKASKKAKGIDNSNQAKPSQVIQSLVQEYIEKRLEEISISTKVDDVKAHDAAAEECFTSLMNQTSKKVQRHFKNDSFSILCLTATKMKPQSYVPAYKRKWHFYPNYHLCHDEILSSELKQRELEDILTLPITSKLSSACLRGELTRDQAIILQDIDVHNDLYDFVKEHTEVDLRLVFALYAQEGQFWLNALLANPEFFRQIEEHMYDRFHQEIWDRVVENKLKLWQYPCVVGLHFEKDDAIETLLLGEELWDELNEYAGLYEVEEELRQLIQIHKPKKEITDSSAQISLTDIYNVVNPIADVTINKTVAQTKKVKRKRKGRYKI